MGLFGDVLGSLTGSTANKAGKTMAAGAQQGIDLQGQIYRDNVNANAPFLRMGSGAVSKLSQLLGLGDSRTFVTRDANGVPQVNAELWQSDPEYQRLWDEYKQIHKNQYGVDYGKDSSAEAIDGYIRSRLSAPAPISAQDVLNEDPGYQFRLDQGNKALDRRNSAGGNFLSGGAVREAMDYNSGLASQEFGNVINRLMGATGVGQNAVSQNTNVGQNYADATSDLYGTKASSIAAGKIGQGNILSKNIGSIFGF